MTVRTIDGLFLTVECLYAPKKFVASNFCYCKLSTAEFMFNWNSDDKNALIYG